MRGPTSLTKPN